MYRLWFSRGLTTVLVVIITLALLWLYHKRELNKERLSYALKTVDLVTIGQYGIAQNGTKVLGPAITELSESENAKMLLLLRTSSRFHATPSYLPADYMFTLGSSRERGHSIIVSYFTKTGELGHDHDWCYVPEGFKTWMKTLPKPSHARYRIIRRPYYEAIQMMK